MADDAYDIAILGTTPMAGLLAGLLRAEHGKRVCLVGARWSSFRLQYRYDLSVGIATRPETWALLAATTGETLKLLGRLGRGLSERIAPLFVADTRASADALGHFRHMAAAHGYAVERVADRSAGPDGAACRVRDAVLLVGGRIEPALDGWLERLDVRRFETAATAVTLRRDGSARLVCGDEVAEAALAVAADDGAILQHLDAAGQEPLLRPGVATAILTEPGKALQAPLITYLDRRVALLQRGKGGILAIAGVPIDAAEARIGACLGPLTPARRAGQASYGTILPADGAPLVGPTRGIRASVLAGFGPSGVFLAPAIARHLAGAASAEEASYFTARQPLPGSGRQKVADYNPADGVELAS